MKREGDRPCAAHRRERPAQVHPLYHPAEVVAVAVAEPVDGVDAREAIKPGTCLRLSPKPCVVNVEVGWPLDANANAPRPDVDPPPNDDEGVK